MFRPMHRTALVAGMAATAVLAAGCGEFVRQGQGPTLAVVTTPATAQDFYRGKTINLIVGNAAGGGYDIYARLLARHMGRYIPGEPTIYEDRSFSFITKQPPAAELIKQAAGVDKGSGEPNREKVGRLTQDQVRRIAEQKMADLNANDVDAAMKIVEGTARSMGVEVSA